MPRVSPFSDVASHAIELLKRKLNAGEFTEREFSRMAHIAQGSLNNVLNGRRKPSIEMMDRICKTARIHPLDSQTK